MDTPVGTPAIATGSIGWMVVRIGDMRAALRIETVGEVLPPPELSPVPMAPAWVAGIGSVRGEVVPVVDTALRLAGRAGAPDGQVVLVAPDDSGERVGLRVDGVAGLIERIGAQVDENRREGLGVSTVFVAARVTDASGVAVPLLDLSALLDPAVSAAT